jgi:hypothetical protein
VLQEERPQGLVAAVQQLRGLTEEVLAKGIVHEAASGFVTDLLPKPGPDGIAGAQPPDKAPDGGEFGNAGMRRVREAQRAVALRARPERFGGIRRATAGKRGDNLFGWPPESTGDFKKIG